MNNPFAPQPSPAPTAPNPFAPVAAAGGVAAIQAAFAAQPAAPTNPFAAAQPPAPAPAPVVPSPAAPRAPTPQVTAFAPLNPPGEAGLGGPTTGPQEPSPRNPFTQQDLQREADAARAFVAQAQAPADVAPTPPAEPASPKRGRKPRAKPADAPAQVGGHYTPDVVTYDAEAIKGAMEPAASDPRNPTRGYSLEEQLAFATTEELREALKSRGWTVTLTDG